MAELMADTDIAIGGGESLQRCCMGSPSLMILLAENQRLVTESLKQLGAGRLIGELAAVSSGDIGAALRSCAGEERILRQCLESAVPIVDGKGAD